MSTFSNLLVTMKRKRPDFSKMRNDVRVTVTTFLGRNKHNDVTVIDNDVIVSIFNLVSNKHDVLVTVLSSLKNAGVNSYRYSI
jgi:hypothetical protein